MSQTNAIKALAMLCGAAFVFHACTSDREAEAAVRAERVADRFPNITLTDQNGNRFRFVDDLIRDRIVCVNFMYTRCTGS